MNIRPFEIADTDAVVRLWHDCDLVVPWNDPHKDIKRKLEVDPDMFLVGVELAKFARDIRLREDLAPMAVTLIVAVVTNMAYGFLAGLAVHYLILMMRVRNVPPIGLVVF